jgi:hypothetical protein
MRFLPRSSAALIARTGVLGLARKNFDRGTDWPASVPPAHEGPEELVWTPGTNTW